MAQVFEFDTGVVRDVAKERRADLKVVRSEQPVQDPDDFWMEVSRDLWSSQPTPVNPENSAGRVLTEMAMVLGGAGFLVLLTIFLMGTPSV